MRVLCYNYSRMNSKFELLRPLYKVVGVRIVPFCRRAALALYFCMMLWHINRVWCRRPNSVVSCLWRFMSTRMPLRICLSPKSSLSCQSASNRESPDHTYWSVTISVLWPYGDCISAEPYRLRHQTLNPTLSRWQSHVDTARCYAGQASTTPVHSRGSFRWPGHQNSIITKDMDSKNLNFFYKEFDKG